MLSVIDPSAFTFNQETLGRAQDIVVQRCQSIAQRAFGRAPAIIGQQHVWHRSARPIDPAHFVLFALVNAQGSMHPDPSIRRGLVEHRLEPPAQTRFGNEFRSAGHELLRDGLVFVFLYPSVSKEFPGEGNHIRIVRRLEQIVKCTVPNVDVHEFVDINRQHPISGIVNRLFDGILQGHLLWLLTRCRIPRIVAAGHMPQFGQPIKHVIGIVSAVIGINKEMIDPDGFVVCDPFQNEWGLILHRSHDQDLVILDRRLGVLHIPHDIASSALKPVDHRLVFRALDRWHHRQIIHRGRPQMRDVRVFRQLGARLVAIIFVRLIGGNLRLGLCLCGAFFQDRGRWFIRDRRCGHIYIVLRNITTKEAFGMRNSALICHKAAAQAAVPQMHPVTAVIQLIINDVARLQQIAAVFERNRIERHLRLHILHLAGFKQEMRHRRRAPNAPFQL